MGNKIEWTDRTWNVITGCKKLSPACVNCYAESMTKRLQGMAIKEVEKNIRICGYCARELLKKIDKSQKTLIHYCPDCEKRHLDAYFKESLPKYYFGWNKVLFHQESLKDILNKRKYPKGSKVFVNSMSDTFHQNIEFYDLIELFDFMSQRQDLIFQILTKRVDRMLEFFDYLSLYFKDYVYNNMPKHIWFGVTTENQEYANIRIPRLLQLKDSIKDLKCFVSIEPMLSEIDLTPFMDRANGLDWVIVGGEKIPNNPKKARLMKLEWVDSIYNQCQKHRIPLFFKQWGNHPIKSCHTRAESCKEFPI